MSDLTLDQLKKAYDAALEQVAAESILDPTFDDDQIILRLQLGNNPPTFPATDPDLPGKLRMTLEQAQTFATRYDIIDAYQNDATGFSAVALRDTANPGRVVMAVRSTEINNDTTRDVGTDLQIFTSGFAFDQILSAQDFLNRVRPQLQPGEKIDLVGYSLSGNVVRTMAAMYPDLINQSSGSNVVFNATGLGGFSDPMGQNRPRSVVLLEMMSLYREVEADPNSVTDVPLLLQPLQLTAIAAIPVDRTDPNGNVYPSPRNDFAEAYVQHKYTTFYNDFGTTVAEPSFAQYFGVAMSGFDAAAVANSGSHPVPVGVAIEGQPVANIPGVASRFEYLNTHSLTLMADSLRLQVLFKEIDPNLSMGDIQTVFQASSASSANTILGRAEKDTLENALDAVRKALLPIDPIFQPTPSSEAASGFGLISNRTVFHTNITTVENVLSQVVPGTYRIESLVNRPLEEVKGNALLEDVGGKGLAYRYALKELNPFAIIGPTYSQHNPNGEMALFNPETGTGSITIDYIQDRGLFLAEKIALNQGNRDIPLNLFALTHYHDNTTGYDIPSGLTVSPGIQREYIFGSDIAETLAGGSLFSNDHLYGGNGVDTLLGNGGNDYLQGDEGNDTLDGGSGADRMLGGRGNDTYIVDNAGDRVTEGLNNGSDTVQSSVSFSFSTGDNLEDLTLTGTSDITGTGNELDNLITGNDGINRLDGQGGTDHLIGGVGNDILAGGTSTDLLEGGAGFDTYYYNNGDGIDQIEDSDATGKIVFNGGLLQGGISTDGGATYVSLDGTETYVLSGGHLIVNGVLTVNANFQSGQFGIELKNLSAYPTDTGIPTGPFVFVDTLSPEATNGGLPELLNGPGAVYGNSGNNVIQAGFRALGDFNDLLDGGAGNDTLISVGQDYLIGGPGNDYAYLHAGGVFLGGDDADIMAGSTTLNNFTQYTIGSGAHYADGGAGNDILMGALGVDVLKGGEGDDQLWGENRPAGWMGQVSNGQGAFISVVQAAFFSSTGAADYLDGGAGNDYLRGDAGNDILSGGAGNDQLFGDDEAGYLVVPGDDILDGGAGDDLLAAGDGGDSLSGGAGIDLLFGDKGDDILDGGDDADTLHGGNGADELFGGGGNDLIFGDGLNNQFVAGTVGGADFLDGGDGNDELQGGVGVDQLFGGAGDDLLLGQEDNDTLFGDEGHDQLAGGLGNDLLSGDAGDDLLNGDGGDDTLFGDEGNDAIAGNEGNDSLIGGVGNDILDGGTGSDALVGGAGSDVYNFSLGDGQDTIMDTALAGEGNFINFSAGITLNSLTFHHDHATQTLTIQVAGGDSLRLLGFDPHTFNYVVETLHFADGTFVALPDQLPLPGGLIEGTDESNVIRTGSSDDTIFAGAGNDFVNAGGGNDLIVGGVGADALQGGVGQDTYVFSPGDGTDTISDAVGEANRLVFGAGVSSSALTLGRDNNNSLDIQGALPTDHVRLTGGLLTGASPIDTFEFADGTILSFDQFIARGVDLPGTSDADVITGTSFIDRITGGAGNDVLFGEEGADHLSGGDGDDVMRGGDGNDSLTGDAGNDSLEGEAGDDVLVGGAGDDQLLGGAGADTYQFHLGDGIDNISDSMDVAEPNRVVFGSGITSSSITLTTDFGQILVRPSAAFEGVKVGADGSDALGFHAVDLFQFEDGTSLTYADLVARGFDLNGTEFDDWLFGTNVIDRFRGGLGNDRLEGGEENDTYFFNLGDGVDTIVDIATAGANNDVVFGAGIASADLRLDLAPDQSHSNRSDLLIRVGTGGDAIQLDTFDRTDVVGLRTVESFRFADGSLLTYDQLLAQGFDLTGTDGDDQMSGTNVADRIAAGDGADVLQSGLGDDSLDGGAGNDRLVGGQGNDTYVFGPSSGHDTILEFQGSQDTIRVAAGVAPSDVVVTRQNRDLVLSLNGGAAQLTVLLYFAAPALQVEHVTFADGTVWDRTVIETLAQPTMTGTAGSDSLLGTSGDDRLAGLAGDDQLTGLAGQDLLDGGAGSDTLSGGVGDDRLDGGPGADTLIGGVGDDTYVVEDAGDVVTELAGEGIDTVQSSLTYTLGANVEHLTLTGSAAINGTGNVLNNVLTGNRAVNVLTGGLGDDTYVIGPDDTVVEQVGEGTDTIATDQSYALGADLENLTLIGNQSVNGSGNALDNVLTGNAAANILTGGIGNDTYVVGANDIVVESAGEGTDTIQTAQDYRLEANVENLILLDTKPTLNVGLTSGTGQLVPVGPSESFFGTGNALDNVLVGNRADNALEGLSGNDRLDGRGGNDTLMGGAGADTYLFGLGHGQDRIDDQSLGGEIDTIQFAAGLLPYQIGVVQSGSDLVLRLPGSQDSLTLDNFFGPTAYAKKVVQFEDGTMWDETMLRSLGASQGPGVFFTDPGTSPIDNVFSGTAGDDEIRGTIGNDTIFGGAGNDILRDNQGNNILDGGSGDDSLFGGGGNDTFVFGRGYSHDTVFVDHLLRGSLGLTWSDVSTTDTDTIQLVGLQASDVAIHMQASDAGQASFTITVLDTADQLTVRFRNGIYGFAPAPVILTFSDGTSQAVGPFTAFPAAPSPTVHSLVDYVLGEDEAHLVLLDLQSEVAATARTGIGNSLDNVMLGNTADNILDGGAGNDVLSGGFARSVENFTFIDTGSDILLGGEGDDVLMPFGEWAFAFDFGVGTDPNPFNTPDDLLIGGPGNDTYYLQHAGQTLVELPDEGVDTVRSTVTYTLPDNVENLVLIPTVIDEDLGIPALIGTGNTLDNVLIGGGGEDLLIGGAGHDTLYGGSALSGGDIDDDGIPDAVPVNDTLVGGAGHDTYLFNVGDGLDTIDDTVTVGEGNRIQFGLDIGQSDLTFVHDEAARTLMIQVGSRGTDQLRLTNFDPTGANGSLVVATLAFADGSTAQLADLLGGLVNHAPTVATPLADQTVAEDAPFSLAVPANTFADEDAGDLLTLSASLADGTALPAWLTFDAATRTLSGTPDDVQVGELDLRVTATDTGTLSASNVFTLTVANVNEAPTVAVPLADQQATEDVPFSLIVPVSTFADVDAGDTLTYSATLASGATLPTWLSFNPVTRTFNGTPLNSDVGTLTLAVKATDLGGLSATDTIALAIQNVNDAPTVSVPLVDQQATEDAPFSFVVPTGIFADVDIDDQLTYSATLANGSTLPSWLSFNGATLTFSGMPLNSDVGTLNVAVTAIDLGSLSAIDTFAFAIQNVNDAPTVANPLVDQTVLEDAPFSIQVPANAFVDEDAGDVLSYSATLANGSALPTWLSFNATTRTFTGTPDDVQVGTLDLRVTATDSGNLSVSDVLPLTVANVNEAPTVVAPLADQQATQGAVFSLVVPTTTFTDVDPGDVLIYSATLANGASLPSWLSFNSVTRTFNGTPQVGDVGAIDVRVTATDQGNLNAVDAFALTIAPSGGTAGNDTLIGTSGHDVLDGLAGDDSLRGLAGNDTLIGGAGNDLLDGGLGTDSMTGGTGNDTYVVDVAGDVVTESLNSGTDTVQSSITYSLGANMENLTLTGNAAINGTGNVLGNILTGNSAANILTGGAGNDVYVIGAGDTVVETANAGLDTALSDVTTTLSANVELLVLTGASAINGTGNSLGNILNGNNAANTLDGGAGVDILVGLDGNDTYLVDNIGDLVVESANNGVDTVRSTITNTLAANVENLTLTGAAAINGTGNTLDNLLLGNSANNTLTGGAGNDTLDGGAGNDTMVGGTGNDTYVVTAVGDVVTENANEGMDMVQSNLAYTLGANVENLTLIGIAAINGTGNGSANVMIGNNGDNVFSGAGGADTLRGGLGSDTLNGGSGNDTFLFGRGDGQDLVQDNSGTADKLLYDAGINPLDLVISRQANNLRLSIHGSTDHVMIQNWYASSANRTETIQVGNSQTLLSTQVDQLIQAMAGFTQQTGLTWDQAIDQRPQDVQTVLAASWQ